jgi:hypothetical protein
MIIIIRVRIRKKNRNHHARLKFFYKEKILNFSSARFIFLRGGDQKRAKKVFCWEAGT